MQRTLTTLTLSALLTVGMCGASAVAQDQSSPGATQTPSTDAAAPNATPGKKLRPKREIKRLVKQLSLTPDQQTKLEPVVEGQDQQIDSVNSDTALSEEQKQTKIRTIRHESEGQIEAMLTDAQKQQYQQMKQNRETKKNGTESQPAASPSPSAQSPQ